MEAFKIQQLIDTAREVQHLATTLGSNEIFARLQHNMQVAVDFVSNQNFKKPLIITIAGGTGVGKSYIFSNLCGIEGISPSSASVRGFTRKLYISADEENRAWLSFSPEEAKYIDSAIPGIVMIDTPDLDTIYASNARISRETIAISDIIVCVTTPDKRSDFSVNQHVLEWASRKRWFFVMNKADTAADTDSDQLKRDFIKRLNELAFKNCQNSVFVFSANSQTDMQFSAFRDTIASSHSIQSNQLLKQEAVIKQFLHALNHQSLINSILKMMNELKNLEDLLQERLFDYEKAISQSGSVIDYVRQAFSALSARFICNRHLFFLYPFFAVQRWLSDSKDEKFLERHLEIEFQKSFDIKNCYVDERHILEDHNLWLSDPKFIGDYENQTLKISSEVSSQITDIAQNANKSWCLSLLIIIANLLPSIVLFQIIYRSIFSWLEGKWLPTDFFVHGIFIIIAAAIPGYYFVSKIVQRQGRKLLPEITKKERPFNLLRARINQIEEVLQLSSKLNTIANEELKKIQSQIPETTFGITTDE